MNGPFGELQIRDIIYLALPEQSILVAILTLASHRSVTVHNVHEA